MKKNSGRIIIKRVGTKYYHDTDFVIKRPHGSGDYIFIKFLNSAQITFSRETVIAKPGNCIFISPRTSHILTGYREGLGNDWLHFKGTNVKSFLDDYELPLNKVIPAINTAFVREILHNIRNEVNEPDLPYSQRLMELLFEQLCVNVSRSLHSENSFKLSPSKKEHLEKFRQLRKDILETFNEDWTVEQMAQDVFVSSSRFAVLYKEFFGVSPIAELLHARIEHAKWLLTNTTLSVNQVAAQSGFKNVYYFSRKFREYVGCPPSRFYQLHTMKDDRGQG